MNVTTSHGRVDDILSTVYSILKVKPLLLFGPLVIDLYQESDSSTGLRCLQYCLCFCLIHVENLQTKRVLRERSIDDWWSFIHNTLDRKAPSPLRHCYFYCFGIFLYISGAGITSTQLNEPWGREAVDDTTLAEVHSIYGNLFATDLGAQPRYFGKSEQQRLEAFLEGSELFKDTPLPSGWYDTIRNNLPGLLPTWSLTIPEILLPELGMKSLTSMRASINQFRKSCPSLHDRQAYFSIILASYGSYTSRTKQAIDRWATSDDGLKWYHWAMTTFRTEKEPALNLLILAVFLSVPAYRKDDRHLVTPFLDLGIFVDEQRREAILEMTASSVRRVLQNANFQETLSDRQQKEYGYLSGILDYALDENPTLLGCIEGTLDRYWMYIFAGKNHDEAFNGALHDLEAKCSRHDVSLSRTTSSTVLNENIGTNTFHTQGAKVIAKQRDLPIHAVSNERPKTLADTKAAPKFTILVLGAPGVGKSCLTAQFVHHNWIKSYDPTVQDSYSKQVEVDGRRRTFEIVDMAGTEDSTVVPERYIKQADGFLLVFSITNKRSFHEVIHLREQIVRIKDDKDISLALVSNKSDLEEEREVPRPDMYRLSQHWGSILYYETSAYRRAYVDEVFVGLCRQIIWKDMQGTQVRDEQVAVREGRTCCNYGACVVM